MKAAARLPRLVVAQFIWLRGWTPAAMALGLGALPLGAMWLVHRGIMTPAQLPSVLRQIDERFLPLWALVAASLTWSDAESGHRPLLHALPVRAWEMALSKMLAASLGYAALATAMAAALRGLLPTVLEGEVAARALPYDLLLLRSLLPAAVLVALAAIGGAFGSAWAGLLLGGSLWLLNLLDASGLWLDQVTAGTLNLFGWTRGSRVLLEVVNLRQAVVALVLHGLALWAPGMARRL